MEDFIDIVRDGEEQRFACEQAGQVLPMQTSGRSGGTEIAGSGLPVTMVTADYDVLLNNANGPNSLDISASLDVAQAFNCDLIRVCMKSNDDIEYARQAADLAAKRGFDCGVTRQVSLKKWIRFLGVGADQSGKLRDYL